MTCMGTVSVNVLRATYERVERGGRGLVMLPNVLLLEQNDSRWRRKDVVYLVVSLKAI